MFIIIINSYLLSLAMAQGQKYGMFSENQTNNGQIT